MGAARAGSALRELTCSMWANTEEISRDDVKHAHVNPYILVVGLALVTHSVHTAEAMGDLGEAEMGGPAQGSALEGLTSSAWREIAEISGRTADELYDPLCFIENDVTDTQVTFSDRSVYQARQPGQHQIVHFST